MIVNNLLMQFQADILGLPVVKPVVIEITALGAAYAAGLACGYWANTNELRQHHRVDREWTPSMDESTKSSLYEKWKKAVGKSFD